MHQVQRLDFLLKYLLKELQVDNFTVPEDYTAKRSLLRSLVNLRPPWAISEQFISVQDAFLQEEASQKGVAMPDSLSPKQAECIAVWQGDITRLAVDAIINAANKELLGCFAPGRHCIDNAIHTAAGVQILAECHSLMEAQGHPEDTGSAKITRGYNLPAKHVIHTVGPQVNGNVSHEHERRLENCYRACFDAAIVQGMHIVAFCCISTGIFGFPHYRAARIAAKVIREHIIKERVMRVVFNVLLMEEFRMYESLSCN